MSAIAKPNALKHGAFSKINFLPGEDPQEFENLKASLFAEYNATGRSEEEVLESIASVMWKQRRLGLYLHIKVLRDKLSREAKQAPRGALDPLAPALARFKAISIGGKADPAEVERILDEQRAEKEAERIAREKEAAEAEKNRTDDERLLAIGDELSLDQLSKELEIEAKLEAVLDRLYKRLWQIKAFKPLLNASDSQRRASTIEVPLLELNANDNAGASQVNSDAHSPQKAEGDLVKIKTGKK